MKNKKVSKKELIKKHNNFVLHKLVFVIQKYKKRPNYICRKLITYVGNYWILQLLINRINKNHRTTTTTTNKSVYNDNKRINYICIYMYLIQKCISMTLQRGDFYASW